jgi:hypothetical protein
VEPTIVIVNFTTRRAGSDDSCIVQAGEHEFLSRESVVVYRRAQMTENQRALDMLHSSILRQLAPVSEDLLRRIQAGALASQFTPEKIKIALRQG